MSSVGGGGLCTSVRIMAAQIDDADSFAAVTQWLQREVYKKCVEFGSVQHTVFMCKAYCFYYI